MSDTIYLKPTLLINGTPFHLASQGLISQGELAKLRREMEKVNETKDRVDISLKEYEELKRENERLTDKLRHAYMILEKLNIPMSMIPNIIPSSVNWYETDSIEFMTRSIRIEFKVER